MSRDELHMMSASAGDSSSGGGASPLTARSLRLERVAQALAHSQEELRRYVSFMLLLFFFVKLVFVFKHLYININIKLSMLLLL